MLLPPHPGEHILLRRRLRRSPIHPATEQGCLRRVPVSIARPLFFFVLLFWARIRVNPSLRSREIWVRLNPLRPHVRSAMACHARRPHEREVRL